ncbi:MAG: CDP-alcohol phosphatidyltransferase family protein [Allosphingosinicella sp.]
MAWLVHAFTASGAVLAILALLALERNDVRLALHWLLAALAVDGIDGTLARRAGVKALVPRIDGAVLDLVIDYLNYVFVPTVLIWKAGLVPAGWAAPLAALIQLSALYVFARADMKSEDNYFRGFPALWNVVAFYLWVIQPGPGVGAASVIVLALASFAPIHFVHPFRIPDYGRWPALLALVWAGATTALLWPGWGSGLARIWLWTSLGSAAVLVALGLLRSLRGRRSGEAPPAGADGEP